MNSLDQAGFLLKLEKAKAYIRLGSRRDAEVEYIKALDLAMNIAKKDEYRDAVRLLEELLKLLEEGQFLESAWAEAYVMIAVCYARLNDNVAKAKYFEKAHRLEPDNADLREIAVRNGYNWT